MNESKFYIHVINENVKNINYMFQNMSDYLKIFYGAINLQKSYQLPITPNLTMKNVKIKTITSNFGRSKHFAIINEELGYLKIQIFNLIDYTWLNPTTTEIEGELNINLTYPIFRESNITTINYTVDGLKKTANFNQHLILDKDIDTEIFVQRAHVKRYNVIAYDTLKPSLEILDKPEIFFNDEISFNFKDYKLTNTKTLWQSYPLSIHSGRPTTPGGDNFVEIPRQLQWIILTFTNDLVDEVVPNKDGEINEKTTHINNENYEIYPFLGYTTYFDNINAPDWITIRVYDANQPSQTLYETTHNYNPGYIIEIIQKRINQTVGKTLITESCMIVNDLPFTTRKSDGIHVGYSREKHELSISYPIQMFGRRANGDAEHIGKYFKTDGVTIQPVRQAIPARTSKGVNHNLDDFKGNFNPLKFHDPKIDELNYNKYTFTIDNQTIDINNNFNPFSNLYLYKYWRIETPQRRFFTISENDNLSDEDIMGNITTTNTIKTISNSPLPINIDKFTEWKNINTNQWNNKKQTIVRNGVVNSLAGSVGLVASTATLNPLGLLGSAFGVGRTILDNTNNIAQMNAFKEDMEAQNDIINTPTLLKNYGGYDDMTPKLAWYKLRDNQRIKIAQELHLQGYILNLFFPIKHFIFYDDDNGRSQFQYIKTSDILRILNDNIPQQYQLEIAEMFNSGITLFDYKRNKKGNLYINNNEKGIQDEIDKNG